MDDGGDKSLEGEPSFRTEDRRRVGQIPGPVHRASQMKSTVGTRPRIEAASPLVADGGPVQAEPAIARGHAAQVSTRGSPGAGVGRRRPRAPSPRTSPGPPPETRASPIQDQPRGRDEPQGDPRLLGSGECRGRPRPGDPRTAPRSGRPPQPPASPNPRASRPAPRSGPVRSALRAG